MTSAAARASAAQYGRKIADSAIQSRLKAMDRLGIDYVFDGECSAVVEKAFEFNLAASTWRSISDDGQRGYTLVALQHAIARHKESSAGAGAVIIAGSDDPDARAETSAGDTTASRLPEVVL